VLEGDKKRQNEVENEEEEQRREHAKVPKPNRPHFHTPQILTTILDSPSELLTEVLKGRMRVRRLTIIPARNDKVNVPEMRIRPELEVVRAVIISIDIRPRRASRLEIT
jgi:hypothetical protein